MLEFSDDTEEEFLASVITHLEPTVTSFKLAPAYILYMATFNTELLFDVHIHGLSGYLAGVSIAVKQVMPDHVLAR